MEEIFFLIHASEVLSPPTQGLALRWGVYGWVSGLVLVTSESNSENRLEGGNYNVLMIRTLKL